MSIEEGLINEWARVSDFYNDRREIGAPGWGMLEVDVKRIWRKRYRGYVQKNPLPGVSREDVNEWLKLSKTGPQKLTDYIPQEPEWNQAAADRAREHGYIPPEDIEHAPFEGGGVREGHGDRPRFELLVPLGVPFEDQLLTRCAVHMAKGARKYEDRNWESFSDEAALERAKASAFRHLMQWLTDDNGEDHAAAVVFNLMAAEHVRAKLK
jgi:hypothetical protein